MESRTVSPVVENSLTTLIKDFSEIKIIEKNTLTLSKKHPEMIQYLKENQGKITYEGINKKIESFNMTMIKAIGMGTFANVYQVQSENTTYAVKFFKSKNFKTLNFHHEVQILRQLNHDNLLKLIGTSFSPVGKFIMTPFYSLSLIEALPNLSLYHQYHFARQIAYGLDYLHQKNIIHCDLKPQNIMLDTNHLVLTEKGACPTVKIIDVGLAHYATEIIDACGTPLYQPPELFIDEEPKNTMKGDIYSYGMLLNDLFKKQLPYRFYKSCDYAELKNEAHTMLKLRPYKPCYYSNKINNLIQECWHAHINFRPSLNTIIKELDNSLSKNENETDQYELQQIKEIITEENLFGLSKLTYLPKNELYQFSDLLFQYSSIQILKNIFNDQLLDQLILNYSDSAAAKIFYDLNEDGFIIYLKKLTSEKESLMDKLNIKCAESLSPTSLKNYPILQFGRKESLLYLTHRLNELKCLQLLNYFSHAITNFDQYYKFLKNIHIDERLAYAIHFANYINNVNDLKLTFKKLFFTQRGILLSHTKDNLITNFKDLFEILKLLTEGQEKLIPKYTHLIQNSAQLHDALYATIPEIHKILVDSYIFNHQGKMHCLKTLKNILELINETKSVKHYEPYVDLIKDKNDLIFIFKNLNYQDYPENKWTEMIALLRNKTLTLQNILALSPIKLSFLLSPQIINALNNKYLTVEEIIMTNVATLKKRYEYDTFISKNGFFSWPDLTYKEASNSTLSLKLKK